MYFLNSVVKNWKQKINNDKHKNNIYDEGIMIVNNNNTNNNKKNKCNSYLYKMCLPLYDDKY